MSILRTILRTGILIMLSGSMVLQAGKHKKPSLSSVPDGFKPLYTSSMQTADQAIGKLERIKEFKRSLAPNAQTYSEIRSLNQTNEGICRLKAEIRNLIQTPTPEWGEIPTRINDPQVIREIQRSRRKDQSEITVAHVNLLEKQVLLLRFLQDKIMRLAHDRAHMMEGVEDRPVGSAVIRLYDLYLQLSAQTFLQMQTNPAYKAFYVSKIESDPEGSQKIGMTISSYERLIVDYFSRTSPLFFKYLGIFFKKSVNSLKFFQLRTYILSTEPSQYIKRNVATRTLFNVRRSMEAIQFASPNRLQEELRADGGFNLLRTDQNSSFLDTGAMFTIAFAYDEYKHNIASLNKKSGGNVFVQQTLDRCLALFGRTQGFSTAELFDLFRQLGISILRKDQNVTLSYRPYADLPIQFVDSILSGQDEASYHEPQSMILGLVRGDLEELGLTQEAIEQKLTPVTRNASNDQSLPQAVIAKVIHLPSA